MGLEADRVVIEGMLNSGWATTDIAWDNVEYVPTIGQSYVILNVLPGEDQSSTVQSYKQIGLVIIQIFTPVDVGTAVARGYADTLAGIFRRVTQSGINFRMPTFTQVGERDSWYQINVSIPYNRLSNF
jgi:hypothetical protein